MAMVKKSVEGNPPTYAVSAGLTSTVAVGIRGSVNISNAINPGDEGFDPLLSYRVLLGDPDQADNITIETVIAGEIVEVDFINGFAQVDDVEANTSLPTFVTFNEEGTYIFTIELIDTNTQNLLAEDVEVAVAGQL